jgi:hypothetical protein
VAKEIIVHDGSIRVKEANGGLFKDDHSSRRRRYKTNFKSRKVTLTPDPASLGCGPIPDTFDQVEIFIGLRDVPGNTGVLTLFNAREFILSFLRLEPSQSVRYDRKGDKFVDDANPGANLQIKGVTITTSGSQPWTCSRPAGNTRDFEVKFSQD